MNTPPGRPNRPFSSLQRLATPNAREVARAVLAMTPAEFTAELKYTPLSRAKLSGLKRNACAVLGNAGAADDVTALAAALPDADPPVRTAAVEALGRLSAPSTLATIRERWPFETDADVLRRAASVLN